MRQSKHDTFVDFLNEKFYSANPMTLDDEWPDAYGDWLAEQDIDDIVRWAQEYADKKLELNLVVKLPFSLHKKGQV